MAVIQKKVCLLGEFAVGKTSLIRQYVEGIFDDKYLSTIGAKISRKTLARGDSQLKLLIWDLAGGEDFTKMGPTYLRGAVGAIVVCDLTREETLSGLSYYAEQLRATNPGAVLVFAGNKADLVDERQISDDALAQASASYDATVLLTSAKTGANVEATFSLLADMIEKQ